jgi:hypothetical protein
LILAPLVFRRLKRRYEFLQIHWYVLKANVWNAVSQSAKKSRIANLTP